MNKLFVRIAFVILMIVIIVVLLSKLRILNISKGHIFEDVTIKQLEECQNVVVLGAKVQENGQMSIILKERAMAVVDLYSNDKVCNILISGVIDFGEYDEIIPVKKYLLDAGIPENIILEDGRGKDTFKSMKNAKEKFGFNNILIVTQAFHLPRAIYIAEMLDIDANGFIAFKYPYNSQIEKYKDILREYPAALKAVIESEILQKNLTAK
jgi:SanA protein